MAAHPRCLIRNFFSPILNTSTLRKVAPWRVPRLKGLILYSMWPPGMTTGWFDANEPTVVGPGRVPLGPRRALHAHVLLVVLLQDASLRRAPTHPPLLGLRRASRWPTAEFTPASGSGRRQKRTGALLGWTQPPRGD